ncbi:hypothetical protein ACJ73_09474 [Blastomyces percursus]|uniref:Uncharacterized protein n=1 Tax=Blastomyces percursus TaxID=1658174 RepID=A0A1J9P7A3_9EURO|nr:hypothetical protein ACJ73_09474 [Blastomyces percursus]
MISTPILQISEILRQNLYPWERIGLRVPTMICLYWD